MIAPARLAAFEVLRAVGARRADLPAALARVRGGLADERDRALAGEIAAGTLRWQGAFDHLIAVYAKRPVARLDGEIADILRLTIFQLLHLDRVPASAAVNDAVNLARRAGKASAAPLVNAVLRRIGRERDRLPLPARAPGERQAEIEYLSTTLSHPEWLVARWRDRHGFEAAEAWCRFDNAAAPLTLRANRARIGRDDLAGRLLDAEVGTRPTRFAPDGLVVVQGNPLLTPLAHEGLFAVQDEASQLVAVVAAPRPGDRVFDACAAPGGKATAMSAAIGDRGLVVAADVRPKRVQLLAETVRAAGASRVAVVRADAARPLPFAPVFDCVLIDAPCSGLGTLRRDPDIKWRRHDGEFEALAGLQLRILRHAASVVRPGGRLVYATCSSEPEENELVVSRFLEESRGFEPARLELAGAPELVDAAGHFRTWPFRDGLEAFFAAALVKAPDLG
jgi:16S rRNA (cytosine967-C5)-methyltransferase